MCGVRIFFLYSNKEGARGANLADNEALLSGAGSWASSMKICFSDNEKLNEREYDEKSTESKPGPSKLSSHQRVSRVISHLQSAISVEDMTKQFGSCVSS